jgi:hypothetical protein
MTPANQEGRGAFRTPIVTDDRMDPSLRELLERTIQYERAHTDQRFVAERERSDATYASMMKLIEQRFDSRDDNLRLQASEYERRMTVLNHAHEAAVKEQARVLPREMFDQFKNEYEKFRSGQLTRDTFDQFRADYEKFRRDDYDKFKLDVSNQLQAIATRSVTWTAAIGLLLTIIMIAMKFLP